MSCRFPPIVIGFYFHSLLRRRG